ncbi:glycosyltransferase [Methanobacterium formicicum]|uniref:Glycosyl transferase family 2 n=1 Tax=Methanobacterium formicicum (strain DSM 3637 / PP1) TaxID=1204725 RepID=K2QEG5_METFP|nr:glycosyltransferase [Methanobacterium formicicum]EKF86481.1 glycosyl transferase family 2 [Methanobacterium formicicum DSM 3637]
MSKIDVIIGVRNEEKHLERCLTSLQNQTITDIQIFVIDGQSCDRTREIVTEKMKDDPRIKLFDNPHVIISSARNIGIKASKAEYIAYLDGHCYVNNDWLEKLLETYHAFEKKCKVGGVGSTYASPDDDTSYGKIVSSVVRTPLGGMGTAYSADNKIEIVESVAFAIYKRSIIEKNGIFYDESMTQCEDADFNYRLIKNGYVLLKHPQALVYQYRRPDTSQFFRQMVKYGEGRCNFAHEYRETLNIFHLIPLLFVIYLLIVILSFFIFLIYSGSLELFIIILVPLLIYFFIDVIYTLIIIFKSRSLKGLYAAIMYPSIHIGYGIGFLKVILKK